MKTSAILYFARMTKKTAQSNSVDLLAIAHESMIEAGFVPDFPSAVVSEMRSITAGAAAPLDQPVKELRELLWSSIDDRKSRDLDQVEYAENSLVATQVAGWHCGC